MALQKTIYINPDNVDVDGICVAQAVAGAAALTLNGAEVVGGVWTGDYARRIGVLSAADDSGITFAIVGTDADNKAITEAVTGSSGAPGTSESVLYFKTITSITSSGAAAGNVTVGGVDEFVTNTIPLDKYHSDPATVSIESITGTIDFSLDQTFTDLQNTSTIAFIPANETAFTNKTVATYGDVSNHATGVRLVVNSYTNGADLSFVINQNRS